MRSRVESHRAVLLIAAAIAVFGAVTAKGQNGSARPPAEISYSIFADSAASHLARVTIAFRNLPDTFRMAMAVHPEYDNHYWRTVGDVRVMTSALPARAKLIRTDSTLWKVIAPGGSGVIKYSVAIHPEARPDSRGSWRPFLRETGALISPIDFLFYFPDFPRTRSTLELHAPASWKAGTGLERADITRYAATTADSLLDSPILLGNLHQWDFTVNRVPHHIYYWPLPNATPFDTAAFARRVEGMAREAMALFGGAPYREYSFLFQDGAWGALEHHNSVTIGIPSADLAKDVNSYLTEIAHEFFHAWNLMAIRPAGWGALSYTRTPPTPGLWWSEGVTMYYAYLLPRRIGYPDEGHTRVQQLENDLGAYFSNPGNFRISPERASELTDANPWVSGDFQGDYFLVGRLLGDALELIIADSTRGRHGLDEVMRAMYARRSHERGFVAGDIVSSANGVCRCDLRPFFRDHVSGAKALDFSRYLSPLGLALALDTIPETGSAGAPAPDTRVWVRASENGGPARLILFNPDGVWAKAGLHSGDELVSFNGARVDSMPDLRRQIRTIKLDDVVPVEILRAGKTERVNVTVKGYTKVRATISAKPNATRAELARRARWLRGRLAMDEEAKR